MSGAARRRYHRVSPRFATPHGKMFPHETWLPFIAQTTACSHNLDEIEAIADFAHDHVVARV